MLKNPRYLNLTFNKLYIDQCLFSSVKIITIVEGKVPFEKVKDFEESYRFLKRGDLPKGLVSSILIKNKDDSKYRIQSTWDSFESLDNMRKNVDIPAAIKLFQQVGVEPNLEIYEIIEEILT